MSEIQQLIQYDKEAFLALNGSNSAFWDGFMWVYTSTVVWIPLALILLYVVIKNNKLKDALFVFVMLAVTIVICDRISSGIFKPVFKRFRPTQNPEFMYLVDIVNGYRGGKFGFISSHAANTFGLLTFTSLIFRKREYTLAFLLWAVLSCYSRIYLGVHYLGDVICGATLGIISGSLVYYIYNSIQKRFTEGNRMRYSREFTSSGYLISDINILLIALFTSIFSIMIIGMIVYESRNL